MKGSYVLLIRVKPAKKIRIGSLGIVEFRPGFYAYVGSAMNSLEKRVGRHLGSKKKMFWHIDYLLREAEIVEVFQAESPLRLECGIAGQLSKKLTAVPGFGCSDCRCESHLFFSTNRESARKWIEKALSEAMVL